MLSKMTPSLVSQTCFDTLLIHGCSAGQGDPQLVALVQSRAAQVAGLRLGRHFSVRDVIKWCRRMQVT